MSYIEILLLAISLCFDTFTVSLTTSICYGEPVPYRKILKVILFFAVGQAFFAFTGWVFGTGMNELISSLDHWIAFAMLLFVGGKMIKEYFHPTDHDDEYYNNYSALFSSSTLFLMATATSIDALAVGVSITVLGMDIYHLIFCFSSILLITAAATFTGLKCGSKIDLNIGKVAGLVGGIVLILIGIKILVEHLIC